MFLLCDFFNRQGCDMIISRRFLICIVVLIGILTGESEGIVRASEMTTLGSAEQGGAMEARARRDGDRLIPCCRFRGGSCGYIDQAGNVIIPPEFDWVERFSKDRAIVGKGEKWGVLDETGKFVAPLVYEGMGSFDQGLAGVLIGDREGVIDEQGQWVIPAKYGSVVRISDQAFLVAEPPSRGFLSIRFDGGFYHLQCGSGEL